MNNDVINNEPDLDNGYDNNKDNATGVSTDNDTNDSDLHTNPEIEIIEAPPEPVAPTVEELLTLERDKYLRLAAEYDNFRKRTSSERSAAYADAKADAVKAFLDVYDALSLALKTDSADAAFKQGVELIMRKFADTLDRLGVSYIVAEPGTAFDPEQHNAILHVEDDTLDTGVIAEELIRGFRLGDRVIRHSMVRAAN